jgi:hypothetical protein
MLSRVLHFLKDEDHVNDSSNLEALLFWGGGGGLFDRSARTCPSTGLLLRARLI